MPFQLVVVQGGRSSASAVKIGGGVTTVGRQEDCQFRIASSMVSRKHCQIVENQGRLIIKDLGSSNGTLVNGKKVVDQQVLAPGDKITIGPVSFRVEATSDAAAVAKPAGRPGETAVAEPVAAAIVGDDDLISIELQDETETQLPAAATKPGAGKAPAAAAAPVEVGEDAVVDFLLNIELDEDDKP
jgi:pSer/pThr/pTyr-binding forkhead associated (FHA) protein